ncbi:MAG: hypothetical protein JKY90_02615 [Gammaproteobacteria bacterium]|nr:hypothetical protein [Gammaproteobacteria bacterium]
MNASADKISFEDDAITIADQGGAVKLNYQQALAHHQGTSWFGVAVAFRALQFAGEALSSADGLWHRNQLYIVSAHPGPGVKDAIEYVTHCVSTDHFRLTDEVAGQTSCGSDMKFHWWVSNGTHTAIIDLRQGFVPMSFTDRLHRLGTDRQQHDDETLFSEQKKQLANELWQFTAADNFHCDLRAIPLAASQLPGSNLAVKSHA